MTIAKPTMAKPRAVYYSILSYQPGNRALLDDAFDVVELRDPSCDDDAALADCEVCFAPLGYMFDAAKMARCPRLRAIVSNTTGVPHIDMEAARRRGIRVLSLKDEQEFLATITPTAEHTIGLMLALIRHVPWAHQAVLAGRWNRRPFGAPAMLSRMRFDASGPRSEAIRASSISSRVAVSSACSLTSPEIFSPRRSAVFLKPPVRRSSQLIQKSR